jgi:LPPG:FO 2-phospho-L-lactate transferase
VSRGHVLALSGGVGGAKLAAGLAAVLPPERLTVAVNTGDDFEHLGLHISPDLDSVVYAMAGLNDRARGWGMAGETWQAMASLTALGEADWFNLGDRDLGMHLARSWRLRAGESLSAVTARLSAALCIAHRVVPMSDDPVRTQVLTANGWLDFQTYFVGEQCRPPVSAIRFAGTPGAAPSPGLAEALARPDLAAVIVCPSNPFLSVDPILAVDGLRDGLARCTAPRVAVSPLIGGEALKGPLAKLLAELDLPGGNRAIAAHYAGWLDHMVIHRHDGEDAAALKAMGLAVTLAETWMKEPEDQAQLARVVLAAAGVD